jgi:photosystem I P700 chlorophyll a apoprotein A1
VRTTFAFAKDPVATSFSKWSQPGHFTKTLAKGPKTTTWLWNLHADAHDFDAQTSSLETISRKIFSAHFGHLSIILLWISGMWFHGARFSNYAAWLRDPTGVNPTAQSVWPVVGQEILNADVGGGVSGIRITSGWFPLWRSCGITSEAQLFATAYAGLVLAAIMMVAGWYHYHKSAPSLDWFQNVQAMLAHHLTGLLGLGCLSWAGHQIHISLPINFLLDAGVDLRVIPTPASLLFNRTYLENLYPSFADGLWPFFTGAWANYSDFLTFKGGLNPVTGGLWLTDIAHHHLALSVIFLFAGHMYRTAWPIGHNMQNLLAAHKGPLTGAGHKALDTILTSSWHAQLAINLAMMGSLSILVAHHMYAMPPYPFLAIDYATQLSLFVHHMWIGGFLVVGAGAHAALFMTRDYTPNAGDVNFTATNLLDRVLLHRTTLIAHLNWVCIFLGTHSFGLYVHNDTMRALGRPQDTFSDGAISLAPIFAKWIQALHAEAPGTTAPNALAVSSYVFGSGTVAVNGRIAIQPIFLGTADFMIHHIHAFQIHVATLILLKGVLFARSSALIPDKHRLGFRFPCDGPGRGGTCQVSPWDHVFLGLFWMYNCISITIFHFFWKMQSDVWGTITSSQRISHLTNGNFASGSLAVNGWLRDFLWAQSSQVIQSYGTPASAYALIFLAAHFTWAFSLMFLFSGRGYWQELIEAIVWAHRKTRVSPMIQPRALSITMGRSVGVAHYLLGGIGTTWSFFLARATTYA